MSTVFSKLASIINPSYTDRAMAAMQTIEGIAAARHLLLEQKQQCGSRSLRPAVIQAQLDAFYEAEKRLKVSADIKQKPALIERDRRECATQKQAAERAVVTARRIAEAAQKQSSQQRERLAAVRAEMDADRSALASRTAVVKGQLAAAAAASNDEAEHEAAKTYEYLQQQAAGFDTHPLQLRVGARSEAAAKAAAAQQHADTALAQAERTLANAVVDAEGVELDAAVNLLLERFIHMQRALDACPDSPLVGMPAPTVYVCKPERVVGAASLPGAGWMGEAMVGQLCDLPWPMGPEVFVDPLGIPDDAHGTALAANRDGLNDLETRFRGHVAHAPKRD